MTNPLLLLLNTTHIVSYKVVPKEFVTKSPKGLLHIPNLTFSPVDSLDLYAPSDEPANTTPSLFTPGHNLTPPPVINDFSPLPTLPRNLDALPNTIFNPDDEHISILNSASLWTDGTIPPDSHPGHMFIPSSA